MKKFILMSILLICALAVGCFWGESGATLYAAANDAQIVSDTIPDVMIAGQSYNVTVTVSNTGTNTWTAAGRYRLAAVGGSDPFTSTLYQNLGSGDSIALGQQRIFSFTLVAPSTTGIYTTDWRMQQGGVSAFGGTLTKRVSVTTAVPNDATIVSDTIPSTMVAGKSYTVSVVVKNTGNKTWTAANRYRLAAVGGSDPFTTTIYQNLSSTNSIAPNQQKSFTFTLVAPSTPGTYKTDWRMQQGGVGSFGATLTKNVSVTAALTNNAAVISDTIPSTMVEGHRYTVSVTVKNTGTSTWTAADRYRLAAVNGSDPFTTTLYQNLASNDSIGAGQQKTFNFTLVAPSPAGTYKTDWRMQQGGVGSFGGTLTKSVTVNSATAWNFLVYMDGDNNLEAGAIADLNELEQVGSTDKVNIFVLIDRNAGYDTSNGDWTSTRLYKVTKDTDTSTINSQLIKDYGELDMSDPATLKDFVIYCQSNYPADHTVLTLWNHGGGVYPKALPYKKAISKGLCWDDTTGEGPWDCLTTDEAAAALSAARGVTGEKIDIINQDLCLGQMIEVAYEWRNEADYLVGSEEIVPGEGNDYAVVLTHLTADPSMSPATLANTLVDDFYHYYVNSGEATTYSAISLGDNFNTMISAFSNFATALNNASPDALADIVDAYAATDYFKYHENKDLYAFAGNVETMVSDTAIQTAATQLKTAIDNVMLNHKETDTHFGKSFGLAVLLPSETEWLYYSGTNQYTTLQLSAATNWDEFIVKFTDFLKVSNTPDTMSVTIHWRSGNVDLGIAEPGGIYDVTDRVSPNGVFSRDSQDGGSEKWTLNASHASGEYTPMFKSKTFNGTLTVSVTVNGNTEAIFNTDVTANDSWYYYDVYNIKGKLKIILAPYQPVE